MTHPNHWTILRTGDEQALYAYAAALRNGEPEDGYGLTHAADMVKADKPGMLIWTGPVTAEVGGALFTVFTTLWAHTPGGLLHNVIGRFINRKHGGPANIAFAQALFLHVKARPHILSAADALEIYEGLDFYTKKRDLGVYRYAFFDTFYDCLATHLPLSDALAHFHDQLEAHEGDIRTISTILATYGLACLPDLLPVVRAGVARKRFYYLTDREKVLLDTLASSTHHHLPLVARFNIDAHRHHDPHLIHRHLVSKVRMTTP